MGAREWKRLRRIPPGSVEKDLCEKDDWTLTIVILIFYIARMAHIDPVAFVPYLLHR